MAILFVTWRSFGQDGEGWGVYGQLFDGNGSKIGSEFQVNTYATRSQEYPSVASFSNGNFVVTWHSYGQDGSDEGIYGQLFDGNGSKIGSEFQVNTYTTLYQEYPSVASFSNGNFVVTWMSGAQDGSDWGVYGQLFDGNGSKIGSEFRANSYTLNDQYVSSVASFSNGNFVVTWHSYGQDGSWYGVYGQIFHDNITYPPSSSTISPSSTSTTKTTSSTTPSVSSSTIPTIVQTRTSVIPSSNRTTAPSTTRPITTSNSRVTLSATSDQSNHFSMVVSIGRTLGHFLFWANGG